MVDFAADDGDDHHQLLMMVIIIIIISFDGGHHLQFLQQGKGRLSLKPATHILPFFAIQKCINDDENDGENDDENDDDNDGDDADDGHWLELSDRHRSLTCLLPV